MNFVRFLPPLPKISKVRNLHPAGSSCRPDREFHSLPLCAKNNHSGCFFNAVALPPLPKISKVRNLHPAGSSCRPDREFHSLPLCAKNNHSGCFLNAAALPPLPIKNGWLNPAVFLLGEESNKPKAVTREKCLNDICLSEVLLFIMKLSNKNNILIFTNILDRGIIYLFEEIYYE